MTLGKIYMIIKGNVFIPLAGITERFLRPLHRHLLPTPGETQTTTASRSHDRGPGNVHGM